MAKIFRWFGKGRNRSQNSSQNDRIKNSRVLLGDLKHCEHRLRCLFELGLPQNASKSRIFFPPLEPPLPLEKIRSEGQTFPQWKIQKDFQKLSFKQRKRHKQRKIYVLPIGPFPDFVLQRISGLEFTLFELLCKFISIFYLEFDIVLKDVVSLVELQCKTRIHGGTGKRQILVGDVLSYLQQSLPKDGFSIIGVSWEDMYPGDEWNFVLGEASSVNGCAAMSFGHYEPEESQRIYNGNKKHSRTNDQDCNEGMNDVKCQSNCESYIEQSAAFDDSRRTENRIEGISQKTATKISTSDNTKINQDTSIHAEDVNAKAHIKSINNPDININNSSLKKSFSNGHERSAECMKSKMPTKEMRYDDENNKCGKMKEEGQENEPKIRADPVADCLRDGQLSTCRNAMDQINTKGRIDRIDAFQIWKFFRVVSHELGHVFGITHCVYFSCAMNESSTVQEAVNQPLFMCPVCLKKIQAAAGFDIIERYSKLKHFLEMVYSGLMETVEQGKRNDCRSSKENLEMKDIDDQELARFPAAFGWVDSILTFLGPDNVID